MTQKPYNSTFNDKFLYPVPDSITFNETSLTSSAAAGGQPDQIFSNSSS